MLCGVVATGFQNIVKSYYVAFYISIGIGDGIAHTGLGGQIYNNSGPVLLKDIVDSLFVGNVFFHKDKPRDIAFKAVYALFLQSNALIIGDVVDAHNDNIVMGGKQMVTQCCSDATCGSGDDYGFAFQTDVVFYHGVV